MIASIRINLSAFTNIIIVLLINSNIDHSFSTNYSSEYFNHLVFNFKKIIN